MSEMKLADHIKNQMKHHRPQALLPQREYAVFLPLVYLDEEWQLLYQVRSEAISQPGEISFPGGRMEPGETPEAAAVRETVEELLVKPEQIEVWGELGYWQYESRKVHAFVGALQLDQLDQIQPNQEVQRLFTISLRELSQHPPVYYDLKLLADTQSDFPFERIRGGERYPFSLGYRSVPFYEDLAEPIWGMTAQFTDQFIRLIEENGSLPF